ncbi:MAG: GDSL-type esterase/lipase family protein [Bacteroidales bacterium]|nr:GDSL-type esterase/lipase family protein [Clostridium sp.]MCM1203326.1 GDSL-type esterase/lipase family protein [Bacteroidales bacterium]
MKEYFMDSKTEAFLKWEGRILKQEGTCYLGYTNSSVSLRAQGGSLAMYFVTGENEEINRPGLRIYIDGNRVSELVLDKREGWYPIGEIDAAGIHEICIVKLTEAAMSYAGLQRIRVDGGELIRRENTPDNRVKVEFIGDSITCGYGVHGEPESEYTIRDEDGECSYAAFMAKEMNWNARWIAASGYGMFVGYSGNPGENIPRLYPYVNWFLNREKKLEAGEFEPQYIFVNLGSNDSWHLGDEEILAGFLHAYEDFLYRLKHYHPDSVIICVLGTLCKRVFPYVKQVADKVRRDGLEGIYAVELPYHNVKEDGMAYMYHPSIATQKKDARRLLAFMRQEGLLQGNGQTKHD